VGFELSPFSSAVENKSLSLPGVSGGLVGSALGVFKGPSVPKAALTFALGGAEFAIAFFGAVELSRAFRKADDW
jgi:hypothetical protein